MITVDGKDLKLIIEPSTLFLLTRISNFLTEHNVKWYIVGGFVRDVLLGRASGDIDITVAANALEIGPKIAAALGGKYVLLDKVNRVGRVVLINEEASAAQGKWELDISSFEGSVERDLARRDFAINAMALDPLRLEKDRLDVHLVDPFNGWRDLRQGTIRVVADPAFEADAARLLRAVRLAAELGFSISPETEAQLQSNAHLISRVAGERLREELLRLLAIPQVDILPYLDRLGLLTAVIPELVQTKEVAQPKEHFWDVFTHSLKTVMAVDFLLRQGSWEYAGDEFLAVVPWSSVLADHFDREVSSGSTRRSLLKLAALLHDIAKPKTKTIEVNGKMRFLGHGQEGAAIAAGILEKLRFSSKEIKLVEILVKHHLRPMQMSQEDLPSRRAIYRYFRDTGETGIDILFFSLADHLATRGPHLISAGWQEHADVVNYVLAQHFQEEQLVTPSKLVDGHDLINIFGMSPGPEIGELLEAVREAQASGELATREEALAYLQKRLSKEAE